MTMDPNIIPENQQPEGASEQTGAPLDLTQEQGTPGAIDTTATSQMTQSEPIVEPVVHDSVTTNAEPAPEAVASAQKATGVAALTQHAFIKEVQKHYNSFDTRTRMFILAGVGIIALIFVFLLWNLVSLLTGPSNPTNIGYDPNNPIDILTPENGQYILVRQRDTRGTYQDVRDLNNIAAPAEMQFDANRYLPRETANYRILSYAWDLEGAGTFNDPQTTPIVTHTYIDRGLKNGRYDVSLRITKEILAPHGEYQTVGEQVTEVYGPTTGGVSFLITTVKPYIDVITTPQELSGVAPFTVEFDASRSRADAEIDEYLWDFDGDNVPDEEGPKVSHTFTRAGVEDVTVEVIDIRNQSSKKTLRVVVDETLLPEPVIEASTLTGDAPLKVSFDGSDSTTREGQITEYLWTFEEGQQPVAGKTAEYTFSRAGKYNVVLEVKTDLGAAAKSDVLITVNTSRLVPTARIRAEGTGGDGKLVLQAANSPLTGKLPLSVNFDASPSTDPNRSIVDWKWDFDGDEKFDASGERASYTYRQPGSYMVTLEVENAAGLTSRATLNVVVQAEDLTADIFADPIAGTAPLTVVFDGAGSSYKNGAITSYEWNFGDGSRPRLTGAQTTYEYTAPGIYTVELKVRTADGLSKTTQKIITVLQEVLSPTFTATPRIGVAPMTVEFNASASVGEVVSYRWDFGDGSSDTGIKTRHTYNTPGNYTVELRVYDKYGAMLPYRDEITVRAP